MLLGRAKNVLRAGLATPLVRDGLRWVINSEAISPRIRDVVHRKIAKRARFKPGEVFQHTTPDGVRLMFLHHGAPNYLYWLGHYEPETTAVFCRLARDARCILDIGAADGLYALLAAATSSARIVAFEPFAGAADVARQNIDLNAHVTSRVELHAIALGDEDTTTTLYVAGEGGGTSSLNEAFRRTHREQPVEVRRGDSFLPTLGIDRVDLLKIDTESTEPAVLRGMPRALTQHPDIVCEVLHDRTERELDAILRPLGYRFFWIGPAGLVERELAGDPSYRHPNYLFTARSDQDLRECGLI